jgi:uncharacterized BrkB/YihY/UPF0761 family membrane protein
VKQSGPLGLVVGVVLSTALYAGLSVWVSSVMPHDPEAQWIDFLPGALALAVGMQAMQLFSEVYLVHKAQSFSDLYGGLGVAAVLLLWLYLIGRLLVGAAMINATRWDRAHHGGTSRS